MSTTRNQLERQLERQLDRLLVAASKGDVARVVEYRSVLMDMFGHHVVDAMCDSHGQGQTDTIQELMEWCRARGGK